MTFVIYFPELEAFARDEDTLTPNICLAKQFSSVEEAIMFADDQFPYCFGAIQILSWMEVDRVG